MNRILVFIFIATGFLMFMRHGQPKETLVSTNVVAFDTEHLFDLPSFGGLTLEDHFSAPLAVMLYFNELSCTTCTSRTLQDMARFQQKYGDCIDLMLVVQGQDPIYLANLRRLGRVRYPILIEDAEGALGWPDTMLAIVDKAQGQIVAHCLPTPDEAVAAPMIADFEDVLRAQLAKFSCEPVQIGSTP